MKFGEVEVGDLPDKYIPLEVVAVFKVLDEHGEPTVSIRCSSGLMAWEAVGMLIAASDNARADLQNDILTIYEELPDEDEEEDDD